MRSALYYPHTEIKSPSLIKSSLLLWDKVEFITPYNDYISRYKDKSIASAIEIVGVPRVPSSKEKEEPHGIVKDLISHGLPEQFIYDPNPSQKYEVWSRKFLPETWKLLLEANLTVAPLELDMEPSDFPLQPAGGLTVMSILADCCAGKTRARITDQSKAYATVFSLFSEAQNDKRWARDSGQMVMPIVLDAIDVDAIPIERLIALREREEKEAGDSLRGLRHNYLRSLEKFAQSVCDDGTTEDLEERRRQLIDDLNEDLKNLKTELQFARNEVLFSKEMIITVLAGATSIAAHALGLPVTLEGGLTVAGVPAAIGGAFGVRNRFLSNRHSIMQRHPMAYLYELDRRALWL